MFKWLKTALITTDTTKKDQKSDQDGPLNSSSYDPDQLELVNDEDNWINPLVDVVTPDGQVTELNYTTDDTWSVHLIKHLDGTTDITLGGKLFVNVKENFDYTDENGEYYWVKVSKNS